MWKILFILFFCIKGFYYLAQESGVDNWSREDKKLFESGQTLYEEKLYGFAYDRFNELSKKHSEDIYVKYLPGICGIFISDKH